MEQIPERLSRHLPFVYLFLEILLRIRNISKNGKIGEKEADIYRSPKLFPSKRVHQKISMQILKK